jgi:hypothetical protein
MIRTVEEWREIIRRNIVEKIDDYELARHVLGDLIAYRNRTQHEAQDLNQLRNLFAAIYQEAKEG